MSKIYVKAGFQQIVGDKVTFSFYDGVSEVETENIPHYDEWRITDCDEQYFNQKIDKCIAQREEAYEKLNQDELRYDDLMNNTNTWVESIQAIKEKFPKPTL